MFKSFLCLLGVQPAWVALGKLHSPRAAPEERSGKRFRASISGGTPTPTKFYPCHPSEPGGEAEEPNAEGGPEGKNKKLGLLGSGSSPLE